MSSSSSASAEQDPSLYAADGRLKVGLELHKSDTSDPDLMAEQSWCNVDGTTFETRIGPNYQQGKRKDFSQPCLYECAAVDLYETPNKISHVGRLMSLPGDSLDDGGNDGYLPQTFIVNFQIPNYALENALWGTCAGDGQGYSLVFYFVLSAYGREQVAKRGKLESAADDEQSFYHGSLASGATTPRRRPQQASGVSSLTSMFSLSGISGSNSGAAAPASSAAAPPASAASASNDQLAPPASNSHYYYSHTDPACFRARDEPTNAAVRLVHNFVESEDKGELRQRFKGIARMMNVDKVGLGGPIKKLVSSYNATPFLIRTCSVFWRGDRYFEVDVDVHRFSYTARLGLRGVQEKIKSVVFDIGFVIEGHSDFELPENMLGAVRMGKLDLSLAKKFPK